METHRIATQVPPEILAAIDAIAVREKRSRSFVAAELLAEAIEARNADPEEDRS